MAGKSLVGDYNITTIAQLSENSNPNTIVGVIIAKQEPKWLTNLRGKSYEAYILEFTLRDSPIDTINLTCWGSKMGIKALAEQFHIGDVVAINNMQVLLRENPDPYEIFKPSTSSPFQIKLDERHSVISLFNGDTNGYKLLLHIPIKVDNDFYILSDILYNGQNLHGEFINLLVAVKKILEVKNILTKNGKHLKKCEIKIFDQTSPQFSFTIWNEENINVTKTWIPKQTDAKITYDEFRKTMVGSSTNRTVITVNPDTQEAQALFNYAQSLQEEDESYPSEFFFDINAIQTIYTAEDVQEKMKKESPFVGTEFCGIIYGYLTNLNIDSTSPPCSVRCSVCRRRVTRNIGQCVNPDCTVAAGIETFTPKVEFDIFVSISDHSGSLQGCRLTGAAAEKMLQCSVDNFLQLSDDEKTNLKWRFLLEHCKTYFRVLMKNPDEEPTLTVLSCDLASINELFHF